MIHRASSVVMAAGLLGLGAVVASAQDARTVYAAMPFDVERGMLRTSACLQLTERAYPSTRWWENASAAAAEPGRAFAFVIAAIKQKQRDALLALTDPTQLRNTAEFDKQATAFFQQFESIELAAVPREYELDGLAVFFGQFRSRSQTAFVPLTFAYEGNDTYGFLPSRTTNTTFRLVTDWFAPSGSAAADGPVYCKDSDVKRATHRISLVPSQWRQSTLLLTGAPIDAPGTLSTGAAEIKSTIDKMKRAFRGPDVEGFFKYQTPEDGARLRQWFVTASQAERLRYKTYFIEQQPFFVFDESPLLVVYTRMRDGGIRVLYFKVGTDKQLLWMNSSYLTLAHPVFERGPLFAAAASTKPFSSLLIK
jgi:hypothetical protein